MVCRKPAFPHQLRDMAIAERKIQVPTHATKNDLTFVMSPMERVIRGDRHGLSFYAMPANTIFATQPVKNDVVGQAKFFHKLFVNAD